LLAITSDTLTDSGFSENFADQYLSFLKQLSEIGHQGDDQHLNNEQLFYATCSSRFVREQLLRHPDLLTTALDQPGSQREYLELTRALVASEIDSDQLNLALRRLRNRAMVGIIWRDFNRLVEMEHTTQELTWLAESCVQVSLDFHHQRLAKIYGNPVNGSGKAQPMLVLGMGKLGAGELNLSSDIDLIFAYPESGDTDGKKSISNQEFFTLLGKQLIQSLNTTTAEGFVFRVDMRLRPFGESGSLVCNFGSLEDYYQTQGREWERYAMIKARVIAATSASTATNPQHITQLNRLLASFTYRRYVDYSVIEALRNLKKLINQEVARRKLNDDVKLGSGGIREVEFIVQAFQLIRGGRDLQLQDNRLLVVLPLLEELNCLPDGMAEQLANAYRFLRNTEHAIQGFEDKQTQKLPSDPDQQLCIAKVMGFDDWTTFAAELKQQRNLVQLEFAEIIAEPDKKQTHISVELESWQQLWHGDDDSAPLVEQLSTNNYEDPQGTLQLLDELRASTPVATMQPTGRQRLDELMPQLLSELSREPKPSQTLGRIAPLIKSVARRSAYLLLLIENPSALTQLVRLASASPWISEQLVQYPALLDELLDPRSLYSAPEKSELMDELRRLTLRIPSEDLEQQMEALRYFRSAHALRVAACEISGVTPLMKVSDYLTWLAEAILDYLLNLSWAEMTAKFGYPDGDVRDVPKFIIIGYGKLGGIELGHGSDLDLVFLHDCSNNGTTDGDERGLREIDNQTFFMRMGQRIIHLLNTRMASGQLYEVDMRLRPSGNSGMLVTTLPAFEKYQLNDAWTWEHQALVRARYVAGDGELGERFNRVRRDILEQHRDPEKLRADVVEMREKMRQHLGSDKNNDGSNAFNLKQDRGGIVDIEFMVQYTVLAWAHQHSALTTYTDNIRILECLAQSGLLSTQEVDTLTNAYKAFRSFGHRLTLQQLSSLVESNAVDDDLSSARDNVSRLWAQLMQA